MALRKAHTAHIVNSSRRGGPWFIVDQRHLAEKITAGERIQNFIDAISGGDDLYGSGLNEIAVVGRIALLKNCHALGEGRKFKIVIE